MEVMRKKKEIKGKKVKRVELKEIKKKEVMDEIENKRDIDEKMVEEYIERSEIDYMVGLKIQKVIWRKIKGERQEGRVKQVEMSMV